MKKRNRVLATLSTVFFLAGCQTSSASWTENGTYYAMDTFVQVYLADPSGKAVCQDVANIFAHYADEATKEAPVKGLNNVYTINHTDGAVAVDDDLLGLLKAAMEMKTATAGAFNPLIGKLSDLWKSHLFPSEEVTSSTSFVPSVPAEADIAACLNDLQSATLTFDGNNVTLQGGEIDLGGIAKGYAAAKAKAYFLEHGLAHYYVNAGSSTVVLGENFTSYSGSLAAYQDCFDLSYRDTADKHTYAKDCCLGTSAASEQKVTIGGKLYSHIVNPLTGSAAVGDVYGTTLFGQDAGVLDALSTAFYVLGPGEATAALEKEYGITCFFYDQSLSITNNGVDLLAR